MKKLLIIIIIIFLVGCSKFSIKKSEGSEGINIFTENENIKTNYIAKNKNIMEICNDFSNAAIIYNNGATELINADFYINDKKIIYDNVGKNGVEGIYLTDDYRSITDAYYDMEKYLKNNERVMAVLLDGFSYTQFKKAQEENHIPFLSQYFKYPALSVFTPVTNSGYAAIITGKYPDENGVHDRSVREMNVKSIFDYALNNNINTILLEGDIKILNTEIEPVLHVDINKDGDTDDEMQESALKAVNEDYDFIFIHYHGIDDRGHSFGPYADETMEYIKKIDGYLKELSDIWDAPMILVPDHGMHEDNEGGNHGICMQSDMIVPYFIKEK